MITKERLEELIKEGATIYTGGSDVHLLSRWHFVCSDKLYENHRYESDYLYDLEELFETEEEADKYMKECIDINYKIAVLERALELACEDVGIVKVITKVLTDDKTTATVDDVAKYYINQSEKELEEENGSID